jgi:hypothetical protein
MKGKSAKGSRARSRKRRAAKPAEMRTRVGELLQVVMSHPESGPLLYGGDVDADWERAWSSGEEAVGGSVSTADQDVVDEIGRAFGVEQPSAAPVVTSAEVLRDRDRRYWELERRAQKEEDE